MENQQTLFKGELMEEQLRKYFLNLGYFVVRGIKYKYQAFDITDVDLFLYGRTSTLSRHRINVDIKNKKTPQAFERILWANGLMKLLNFDSCLVATTDPREVIKNFGQLHNTIVLDGIFLSKLRSQSSDERISEEDLTIQLSENKSYKTFNNKDWRQIYETSKSRLLTEMDFSGFNATLQILQYFLEKTLTDSQKKEIACRAAYIILSHGLIILDYILKDIVFLEQAEREKKLSDGFKFGNLGKEGIDRTISMALKISGNNKSINSILSLFDNLPTDILRDFFSKNENSKNLFLWAREFESLAFKKEFFNPNVIDTSLKSILALFIDYCNLDRKKFFENFN